VVRELVPRGRLPGLRQRQQHVAAGRLLAAEHGQEAVDGLGVGLPGEEEVVQLLDVRGGQVDRLVADDVRVLLLVRIDPQEPQRVAGRLAAGDRFALRVDDVAAGTLVLGNLEPAVVVVVAVVVGLDHLAVVQVDEEQREQHKHDDTHSAQRRVHRTTSVGSSRSLTGPPLALTPPTRTVEVPVAGRRAASEVRSNGATSSQLATSDDPPADRNGVVCPVSGINWLTPPTMTNTCNPSVNDRPPANSLPNKSRTPNAARSPRSTMSR